MITILVIIVVVIAALAVLLALQGSGPRVTTILRRSERKKDADDA